MIYLVCIVLISQLIKKPNFVLLSNILIRLYLHFSLNFLGIFSYREFYGTRKKTEQKISRLESKTSAVSKWLFINQHK